MKKSKLKMFCVIIFLALILLFVFIKTNNKSNNANNLQVAQNIDESSNDVNEYTEEFMNKYFEDSYKLQENNNKENILIVISEEEPKNTYGSTHIVKAPNNQFIIQYNTEWEKENALNEFKKQPSITVEENNIHKITEDYNSWGIEKTGIDHAIDVANTKNLNNVTVAIIDSGCDLDLFNNNFANKIAGAYNVLNSETMVTDEVGHGTHIAGTIAEGTPNNVKIFPVKVSETNEFYTTDIIQAINYITYNQVADAINMSFGSYEYSESEYQAIETAKKKNIISVCAAGNDDISENSYPAAFDNTISISATDSDLSKASYSNYGSTITFSAPGTDILSINGTKSGTSMAAPHAVSAVAILKSYNNEITLSNTIELLKKCAIDLGDDGWDKYYGYGFINFKDVEFYNGDSGDEYNIFKLSDDLISVKRIEFPESISPLYNYGNNTNIMNAKVKIYYNDNDYYIKQLYELDNVEINGYDPYNYCIQYVNIKYNDNLGVLEVNNENATIDGWEYKILEDDSIGIVKFKYDENEIRKSYPQKVYIPEKIEGNNVKKIEENAFYNCFTLRAVIVPEGVETIGNYSFYGCKTLRIINLTDSIKDIGENAFYNCSDLESINIPNVKVIKNKTFMGCTNLKRVELSKELNSIGQFAFANCSLLESIQFSDKLSDIGAASFDSCQNLKELNIPKNLVNIGNSAFDSCSGLESIIVNENNTKYDSRDNCNALIETENNRVIVGSANSEIPSTIKIIYNSAFSKNRKLKEIIIHEGVEKIGWRAFSDCYNLKNILIPQSVNFIDSMAFKFCDELTLWVYKDSYAETYAKEKGINYKCIETLDIPIEKYDYNAFEKVNIDNMSLTIQYGDGETEVITEGINVKYSDSNGEFRFGDTSFIISAYNKYGIFIEKQINVTINKATPEYTIPDNITAQIGQKISEIELPNGFKWMNGDITIDKTGNITYKAKYIPEDIDNYEIVENIDITISVENTKTVIKPNISIENKTYDGTTQIDMSDITVSNLNNSEYSIVSAVLSSADIGERTATIKLRLSDEKYEEYSFDNGMQEKEFEVDVNVLPLELIKPTIVEKEYVYNGNEQTIELNNFVPDKMSISGNKRTNAGEQSTTISLKNNNYIWNDGTRTNIEFTFKINKADSNIQYSSSNMIYKYDGEFYGIELNLESPSNAIIKYADENDEYILDEMPQYNEIGTYTIKYRIYINDNFTDILGENTLAIVEDYVIGDINGDGKVNIKDWNLLYNHINETELLTGYQLLCADINGDGKVNIKDWNRMYDHITEVNPLW